MSRIKGGCDRCLYIGQLKGEPLFLCDKLQNAQYIICYKNSTNTEPEIDRLASFEEKEWAYRNFPHYFNPNRTLSKTYKAMLALLQ